MWTLTGSVPSTRCCDGVFLCILRHSWSAVVGWIHWVGLTEPLECLWVYIEPNKDLSQRLGLDEPNKKLAGHVRGACLKGPICPSRSSGMARTRIYASQKTIYIYRYISIYLSIYLSVYLSISFYFCYIKIVFEVLGIKKEKACYHVWRSPNCSVPVTHPCMLWPNCWHPCLPAQPKG